MLTASVFAAAPADLEAVVGVAKRLAVTDVSLSGALPGLRAAGLNDAQGARLWSVLSSLRSHGGMPQSAVQWKRLVELSLNDRLSEAQVLNLIADEGAVCTFSGPHRGEGPVPSFLLPKDRMPAPKVDQAASINEFGYRLLGSLLHKKRGNTFISAFSVAEALNMALAGAEGTTREQMARVLRADLRNTSPEALAVQWSTLLATLKGADPKVDLSIANSMWANKTIELIPSFVDTNQRAHGSIVASRDFTDDKTVDEINGWISEKTKGKISEMLKGPIPQDALLYLVNAIYFNGKWTVEFDKKQTRMGEFRRTEGGEGPAVMPKVVVKETPFMNRFGEFSYMENDSLQMVRIPYGEKGRFAMYVALPKEGTDVSALVTGFSIEAGIPPFPGFLARDFNSLVRSMSHREGSVSLPRFKMEFGAELKRVLAEMGMPIAFSDAADFRGMIKNESVKIDQVLHKAVVEVDEAGTVAAAATVIGMVRTTAVIPVQRPFSFVADRPFFFCIRDDQTGTMLFSGVVQEPIDPKGGKIE